MCLSEVYSRSLLKEWKANQPDEIICYNGIQSKLWDNTLTADNLGTFYQALYTRMKKKNVNSKGYLYHTCKLQVDVRDDIMNSGGDIVSNRLRYNEDIQQQFFNEMNVTNVTNEANNELVETNLELRGYQMEAIEALNQDWDGIKLLNLPCGTGKTVIFSNHVREKAYKNIFIDDYNNDYGNFVHVKIEKIEGFNLFGTIIP